MLPILLSPSDRQGEAIVDTPARELRILCEHDWLDATWTRHAAGERGAEPHVHLHHVDAFYVLSGEMTLQVGPDLDRVVATDDTLVLVPPGLVHGFDNDSSGEVRFLNFHAPGCGFSSTCAAGGSSTRSRRLPTAADRPRMRSSPDPAAEKASCAKTG